MRNFETKEAKNNVILTRETHFHVRIITFDFPADSGYATFINNHTSRPPSCSFPGVERNEYRRFNKQKHQLLFNEASSLVSIQWKVFVQENIQCSHQSCSHGIISG